MGTSNREALIEAAARISVLRTQLREAEADFDRLLADQTSASPRPSISAKRAPAASAMFPDKFFTALVPEDKSLNQRIVDALDASPDTDFSAEDVMAALPAKEKIPSIRSALARLADWKRITRAERGKYCSNLRAKRDHAA